MKKPFVPPPLPPDLSGIYSPDFVRLLGEANRALSKLGELPHILPGTDLLAAPLLRKEAVLSSRIEGTQTTLSELFKYEVQIGDRITEKENASNKKDAREVSNYVEALHCGVEDIKTLSLSLRTLKNMHIVLLTGSRSEQGVPGKFRDFQAYIAPYNTPIEQASYVASPAGEVSRLAGELEKYINDKKVLEDPLIQCGLIHYQFEAIHPFGDGNGRIGRLLIPLFFYERDIIGYPIVYVSEPFEKNRREYYEKLLQVSEMNDWKGWLTFFLKAVKEQSESTHRRAKAIFALYKKLHAKIRKEIQSSNAIALIEHIFRHPYTAAPFLARRLNISHATAMRLLERFAKLGILGRERGMIKRSGLSRPVRLYVFQDLINIINIP